MTKKSAKAKKSTTPATLPTENEAWGFWGTMKNNGLSRAAVQIAWEAAMAALQAVLGVSPIQARLLLDARLGRHLADQVDPKASNVSEAVHGTIGKLFRGGRGWAKDAREVLREAGHPMPEPTASSKAQFCSYLRETLIPDLREGGRDATADDFETALRFIEGR